MIAAIASRRFFKQVCLCAAASSVLAACSSNTPVPVSDTKPVLPQLLQAPAATQPSWATQLKTGAFSCEMGNKVEIRMDGRVTDGVTLVWKGSSYMMNPVSTSTGAVRLENKGEGLVWIQIPSKSMLLNSKIGQQLANDCRTR
ncbi:hypothetical protein HBH1_04256 [Herbaspirillum sp. BH-1]|uniref:Signal peptide protein n=2 Tax=Herbaspirillum frisingense TaxID=92645 RepID=A0AAI9N2C3_9BURK|nr:MULTISPECIES: hypothetical protein [Herbaspirillum]EOA03260.1 signal peptide protein [Herbaspirillum frisingense GSF30]MDR6583981.1 hypothetical protein [Herbaspirillum frisingense]ONN66548.1 hypothetical protein BTM36_12110 [Herbaspirillum sp. VT-16-41]PLY57426.1 hypothetical protein HBH1_04256 [Herbaspirillum sp. BH-1]QNB08237.1 hypothetical protein G5S34_16705 [Herbaspirillum frisingense]